MERKWISFVLQHKKKETDVIFMGNKSDIINNYGQIISQSLTREYQLKYFKVSAISGLNISEAMNELIVQIVKRKVELPLKEIYMFFLAWLN